MMINLKNVNQKDKKNYFSSVGVFLFLKKMPRGYIKDHDNGRRITERVKRSRPSLASMRSIPTYGQYGPVGRFQGMGGGELKFLDTQTHNGTLASAGTIADPSLVLIGQGAAESQRIGRKVTVKSIHLQGALALADSAQDFNGGGLVRIVLYQDKGANGTAATVTGATGLLATGDVFSFSDLNNKGKFRTLAQKVVPMNALAGQALNFASAYVPFRFDVKVNIPITYDGADAELARIRVNNIGVMIICSSSLNANGFYHYTARVRYSDS